MPGWQAGSLRARIPAAIDLPRAVGYGTAEGPWIDVGVGLNAGTAYLGNVGSAVVDFTALGDPINVAVRLQAAASGGQLVVAESLDEKLTALLPHAQRDVATARGRQEPVPVLVTRVE